ncbi:hypothetical protein DSECCO2_330810 [anaerobic digester metagenome]
MVEVPGGEPGEQTIRIPDDQSIVSSPVASPTHGFPVDITPSVLMLRSCRNIAYRHDCPPGGGPKAGRGATDGTSGVREDHGSSSGGYRCPFSEKQGRGDAPPSPSAPPPVAISPRSTVWGDPEKEQNPNSLPGHGFPPAIAMTAPAPRGGGGARSAGGVGATKGGSYAIETGEGGGPLSKNFACPPHPSGARTPVLRTFGAHAPAGTAVALRTVALPVSPSKNFVLLMLLPFGQSHSPIAISDGKPWKGK